MKLTVDYKFSLSLICITNARIHASVRDFSVFDDKFSLPALGLDLYSTNE